MKQFIDEVKHTLQTSKNPIDMQAAMPMLMGGMNFVHKHDPALLESWKEMWEHRECKNFITEKEAMEAVAQLINVSGESAPKWKPNALFEELKQLNVPEMEYGVFNKWAIFYTMNWLYSDYSEELSAAVGGDATALATLIYKMSVKKLKDPDKKRWIREHLHLS